MVMMTPCYVLATGAAWLILMSTRSATCTSLRAAATLTECRYCSYFLGHTCDLYYPAVMHCKECCVKMQHQRRSEDSRWGQRGGQER